MRSAERAARGRAFGAAGLLLGLGVGLGLGLGRAVRLLLRLLALLGGLGGVAGRSFVGGLGDRPGGGEQHSQAQEHDANEIHGVSLSLMWDALPLCGRRSNDEARVWEPRFRRPG